VYAGSIEGGVEEAGRQLLSCAVRAGFGANSRVHAVGDGAPWIVGQIEQQFGDQGCYLIDFYHVCEYLGAASAAIAPDPAARSAWMETQKEALKGGRLDAVLRALVGHCEPPQADDQHAPVRTCHRYLGARADQLNYRQALAAGLPIGSGEIESAHRYVAQQRLKRPGAWWRVEHAEYMLALRITRINGDWLDYWTLILGPKFSKKERAQLNLSRLSIAVRAQLRARPVAARRRSDRCDLRHAAQSPHARQTSHGHRPDRARPSCLPRLLQERLPEAVREILDLPAQRAGLQQSHRLRPAQGARPSRCRADHLPGDHRSLRRLAGRVAQRACRFPAAAAPRPSDHDRRGALSRPQDPRAAHHASIRGALAWRPSDRRLDGSANPSCCPHQLRSLRRGLRPQPAALRPAQAQGAWPDRARRLALRLPALTQGRPSRPALPLLPQAPVRPPRQQPLPSPAEPATSSRQPARNRLSPRRCRHPTRRRSLGCSLIAPRLK